MNKAIKTAKTLLDNINLIPGYTGDEGQVIITINQHLGGARSVDVRFSTIEKETVAGGTMTRERVKKVPRDHVRNCVCKK